MSESKSGAGELLREVARLYTRAQRAVADCCRTTATQCHVLTELGRTGQQPLVELGRRLCLEKSWVSRAIDTLVEEGLVLKAPNPEDSRSWLVSLSARGKRRVRELNRTLDEHAEKVLGSLSLDERLMVNQSLALLLRALREDAGVEPYCTVTDEEE
jgi:DNA-binding MarR family transcriptional regulator